LSGSLFSFSPATVDAGTLFDAHQLALVLGAVGFVIVFSGLVSGIVERGPLSQVLVFIALGVAVGPRGFNMIDLGINSPVVEAVGSITLVLIFFTDAIQVNFGQLRAQWLLPALALGPGAILTIALIGVGAVIAFDLSWTLAFLLAACLASTDAILLRDVTRNKNVPRAVRHTLNIEAGANDVIILPIVLVLATIASHQSRSTASWLGYGLKLYILGPLIGVAIAYLAIKAMVQLRRRQLVRRDYESIYSVGVALLAFAAAEVAGGSGFLAAFAAGLTIAIVDVELCECFLEYGETTAEMAMLVTFVFLGSALVDSAIDAVGWSVLLFGLFVLAVARPLAFWLTLSRTRVSTSGKWMLAWFGPRGLSSLLLVILAVSQGMPNGARVFGIVSVVVLISTVVHGGSATPVLSWYGRSVREGRLPEETAIDAGRLLNVDGPARLTEANVPRTSIADLLHMIENRNPVTIIDVRRAAHWASSGQRIPGSYRVPIDEVADEMERIPRDRPVVFYCACPDDVTSAKAAIELIENGFDGVTALAGGWNAWVAAGYPTEPITASTPELMLTAS
jgi:NhaP-type Na+/H+ or K+/H+ antiporter/rhodanese-related sulfurtransferase